MTYKDAIPEIAEIYAEKGYITERDISLTMIQLSIPMKEIDSLLDVLHKFSLDIRENDSKSVAKSDITSVTNNSIAIVHSQSEPQSISSTVSADFIPDLLFFQASNCHGTGRMLSKSQFILYEGAVISDCVSEHSHSVILKNRNKYQGIIESNVTTENIIFSSSSAAGCFVCGYSVNGKITWKNEMGISLKKLLGEE